MNQHETTSPKEKAFEKQLQLLEQLIEALDRGKPINPGSIWHKTLEDAITAGQGLTR